MRTPFIVAEMGASHNSNFDRALAIVEAAAKAGANAVKLQTFTPELMVEPDTVIKAGPWAARNALELYRQAHTPRSWHKPLFERIRALGMIAFSSVFHPTDVDFLESLGCPQYKIASFEITDLDLIRYAANTGKSIIISTGMANEQEITDAVTVVDEVQMAKGGTLTLLKCTSAYPTPLAECNLLTIPDMRAAWTVNVGLSDHTIGSIAAVTATALGTTMIEKHLTLNRSDGGLDAAFSAEPDEFHHMCTACRQVVEAMGTVRYGPTESETPHLSLRRLPGLKRGELTHA